MVVAAPTLGALHVRGRLILFASDSNDTGTALDLVPTLGTVEFIADYKGPKPLVHLATEAMVSPVTVTAIWRGDGALVPPANGIAPAYGEVPSDDPDPVVRLLAPKGNGLNIEDWTWTAKAKPAQGQSWAPFSQVIDGTPGETVTLGRLAFLQPSEGVAQTILYPVDSIEDPLPEGFRVGIDTLVTPDGTIYGTRSV